MRSFIAIPVLRDEDETYFGSRMELIRSRATTGRFVALENLHMTLLFIGETSRIEDVESTMDEVLHAQDPFIFEISRTGRFVRKDGSIIWMGGESEQLSRMHGRLFGALSRKGFELEDRPFRAHITLARRVGFSDPYDKKADAAIFAEIAESPRHLIPVERVSLLGSKLTKTGPIYTELHRVEL